MSERTSSGIAPQLTLAAIVMAFGAVLALVGTSVTYFALDETLYNASAVHYAGGLPSALFNDPTARATSRLWALLMAPLFAAFDADTAVRMAKVLNSAIWVSVAIPLWLIVRGFLPPWRAVVAVSLSVVAPWAVISTTLFTEPLALVSLVWFTWAAMRALHTPSWWRDLIVLGFLAVAVVARVQMVGIIGGYIVMIAMYCAQHSGPRGAPLNVRATSISSTLVRGFPLTAVGCVSVVPVALLFVTGHTPWSPDAFFGTYLESQRVSFLFRDLGPMYFVEITALGFGLGVVAPVIAAAWYGSALGRPGPERDYATATLAIGGALVAFTTLAQRGYWGDRSEERYFMYLFVFVWPAALAATRRGRLSARSIVPAAIVLVLCAATLGSPRVVDAETAFLAPVLSSLGTLTQSGIGALTDSSRDAIGLAALVLTGGLWGVLRFAPNVKQDLLLVPAVALQLAFTAYPLLVTVGDAAAGAGKRTGGDFGRLGWVDASARAGVGWLLSESRSDPAAVRVMQQLGPFWNDSIRQRVTVAGATPAGDADPFNALPLRVVEADPSTGRVPGLQAGEQLVRYKDSPYVQLSGVRTVATSPDFAQLALVELPAAPKLSVMTTGLGAGDEVPAAGPARLRIWPGIGKHTARLTFAAPQGDARVSVGSRVTFEITGTRRVSIPVHGPTTLSLTARSGAVRLTAVAVH